MYLSAAAWESNSRVLDRLDVPIDRFEEGILTFIQILIMIKNGDGFVRYFNGYRRKLMKALSAKL